MEPEWKEVEVGRYESAALGLVMEVRHDPNHSEALPWHLTVRLGNDDAEFVTDTWHPTPEEAKGHAKNRMVDFYVSTCCLIEGEA